MNEKVESSINLAVLLCGATSCKERSGPRRGERARPINLLLSLQVGSVEVEDALVTGEVSVHCHMLNMLHGSKWRSHYTPPP